MAEAEVEELRTAIARLSDPACGLSEALAAPLTAWLKESASDVARTRTIRTSSIRHALATARAVNGASS